MAGMRKLQPSYKQIQHARPPRSEGFLLNRLVLFLFHTNRMLNLARAYDLMMLHVSLHFLELKTEDLEISHVDMPAVSGNGKIPNCR